jgi:hypothetical protein
MPARKVMICCVTFETAKVVEPIKFYGVDKVHIIHYVKDSDSQEYSIYQDFYDEVCVQIKNWRRIEIMEHFTKVYDYHGLLKTLNGIMESDKTSEIYVNISSGTSEYAAASMIASSMHKNTKPFTVGTMEYTSSKEDIKKYYYENGNPVGLSKKVYAPRYIDTMATEVPAEELVICLGIVDYINRNNRSGSIKNIISLLKKNGIWDYVPNESKIKTDETQKELMYVKRHYLEKLMNNNWTVKTSRNKYELTDEGKVILKIFGNAEAITGDDGL